MPTHIAAANVLSTGTLDIDDALALLEHVVHEKGREYSDGFNTYFQALDSHEQASTPTDVVGHVLDQLGKTAFDLTDLDNPDASAISINSEWFSSIGVDGLEITDGARELLYQAQLAEHAGGNWGKQLDAARHYRENQRGYAIMAAAA